MADPIAEKERCSKVVSGARFTSMWPQLDRLSTTPTVGHVPFKAVEFGNVGV